MANKKPNAITVDGKRWPVHVLEVIECDPDGSPRVLRLLKPAERTQVWEGKQFFVVYGPPALSARRE